MHLWTDSSCLTVKKQPCLSLEACVIWEMESRRQNLLRVFRNQVTTLLGCDGKEDHGGYLHEVLHVQ